MAYTNIDDPSAHFQIKLWTGNASSNEITFDGNSDLQADWIWHKEPNDSNGWHQTDTSIGIANYLASESSAAEYGVGSAYVSAIGSNSITYGSGDSSFNSNSVAQATWAWKANGGTTASNSDGSVTSTTQVNSDAGFSIVTFESASSGNFSVGHGLGVQPAMIITKNREGTSQWYTWHQHLTGGTSNTSYLLSLNRTDAEASYANAWGAGVTSSVFGMQSGNTATASNDYIAYCFSEVQGYSKFGKYVGNGNANGTFVYTGFKPAVVILKNYANAGYNWWIMDSKRNSYNPMIKYLFPNTTNAEETLSSLPMDFVSNGFKFRTNNTGINGNGHSYIFAAFAENPFVTSTGIPTTAR